MNETTICNLALGEIGSKAITSLEEGSQEARVCKRFYAQTRDETLRAHQWNFATKRAVLSRLTDAPAFGWAFQYSLPTDFIRARTFNDRDVWIGANRDFFQLEQDRLLTNQETAELRYVFRQTDATKYDPLFCEVLAVRLASKIAPAITGSYNLATQLIAKGNLLISQARRIDSSEDANPRRSLFQESDLVRSRFFSDVG
jgi:hypothetical protein